MKKATIKERKVRLEAIETAYNAVTQSMEWFLHDWIDGEYTEIKFDDLSEDSKEKYRIFKEIADTIAEMD